LDNFQRPTEQNQLSRAQVPRDGLNRLDFTISPRL
jgi:hypothetical protein